ncbi:hypothetical protein H4219_002510 [Mycoemilia scoparia]|uniref:HMG box domain-containing protein n=1 Tax=Mycoemilia scoparia TaxID=417184 RepID=A0A9W8DQG6_9FUNG|nr:hypothetical protein H4219_002510 [Mycoemilia scoparia]
MDTSQPPNNTSIAQGCEPLPTPIFNPASMPGTNRSLDYLDHADPSCRQLPGSDYNSYFHSRISVPYINQQQAVLISPLREEYPPASHSQPQDINHPFHQSASDIHPTQHQPISHQQQQQQQPQSHPEPQSSFTTLSFHHAQLQDYDPTSRTMRRATKASKPKHTPRPANAFILYRKAKQAEVIQTNPGVSNKEVSVIIGNMWRNESPEVTQKYRDMAEVEKQRHKELHPNYKYQPRKPKAKRQAEAAAAAAAAAAANAAGNQFGDHSGAMSFHPYTRPPPPFNVQPSDPEGMYRQPPSLPHHPHSDLSPVSGPMLSPPPSSGSIKGPESQFWPHSASYQHQQQGPSHSQLPQTPISMGYHASSGPGHMPSSQNDYYYQQTSQSSGTADSLPSSGGHDSHGHNMMIYNNNGGGSQNSGAGSSSVNVSSDIGRVHNSNTNVGNNGNLGSIDPQSMGLLVQPNPWASV